MERLKKEADIMYTLRHPGICNIYNVGVSEDIPYIAMELINGLPLSELLNYTENDNLNIKKETMSVETIPDLIEAAILNKKPKLLHRTRRLSLRNFFLLIGELGEIIALAHNNGIVHRDIKPANIIIRKTGEPVFMDFGLSVSVKEGKNLSKMPIEGSLDYLAPELLEKDTSPSFKSDIYSFGALMYLLLTGRKHFARSTNLLHDLQNLKDLKIKSLSEYNPMVPENLNTLVSSCLSQKPQNRYASMENLMSDLDDCRRGIFKRSKTKKENPFKKVKSWFKS
jgi:serine/threonine-protein kinase